MKVKIDNSTSFDADAVGKSLQQLLSTLVVPDSTWTKLFAESNRMRREWDAVTQALRRSFDPFREFFDDLAKDEKKHKRLDDAGWLPHRTTPFDALPDDFDAEAIDNALSSYYKERWEDVRCAFQGMLTGYDIDAEAKATFVEALEAHTLGHYRCVPRLLFPEIERVVRDEFFPGDLKRRLASQPDLREAASGLSGHEVSTSFAAGMHLYKKLTEHLYIKIGSDADLEKVARSHVPNRHAAIHGLVVYKTEKASLNALIMTEFAFHLVSVIKRSSVQTAA
jgi:hypothetical protein